jgi:hypothetical protein
MPAEARNVVRFTNISRMLSDLRRLVQEHPGTKVVLDDNPMKLQLGFRVETPEGEAQTWAIGLTDLKRSYGGLNEAERETIKTPEGRAKMAATLELG